MKLAIMKAKIWKFAVTFMMKALGAAMIIMILIAVFIRVLFGIMFGGLF